MTATSSYLNIPTRRASDKALQIAVKALREIANDSPDFPAEQTAREALSDIEALIPGATTGEP